MQVGASYMRKSEHTLSPLFLGSTVVCSDWSFQHVTLDALIGACVYVYDCANLKEFVALEARSHFCLGEL